MTAALPLPRWIERAVCAEVGGEIFFPSKGEATEPAKRLCRSCEVRLDCAAYGLDLGGDYGIFGGFSAQGRERVRLLLRAGRSLADIIAEDDAAYYGRTEGRAA